MSRRRKQYKRDYKPDSVYKSVVLTRFINNVMEKGKKSVAENITYKALDILSKKVEMDALEAFTKSLKNAMPLMEVKSRRVGGSTYQVPIEVRGSRSQSLAMKWIIEFSRKRSGQSMINRLSSELIDAFNNTGATIKKKEDTHKMAEANKAFSHFRW